MLVLTRKTNETIELPGLGVTITLVKIKGKYVRIGVDAPRDQLIVRSEIKVDATRDQQIVCDELEKVDADE